MKNPLHLVTSGFVCPLGRSVAPACAAIRTGMNRFAEGPYVDARGEAIICSMLDDLAAMPRLERMVALLAASITDALRGLPAAEAARMPLLLGIAEHDETDDMARLRSGLATELSRSALSLDTAGAQAVATGHTAGLRCLSRAGALLDARPELPACIVACVDSLVDPAILSRLDRHDRLKKDSQSDGIIPGEAAAVVIVSRQARDYYGSSVLVYEPGFAYETATMMSEQPLRGVALADASRQALDQASLEVSQLDFRIADAAGEGYAFRELALCLGRLLRVRRGDLPLILPAESLGDTGAASGLAGLVLAAEAMRRGWAPGSRALLCSASLDGDRAAAVVTCQHC